MHTRKQHETPALAKSTKRLVPAERNPGEQEFQRPQTLGLEADKSLEATPPPSPAPRQLNMGTANAMCHNAYLGPLLHRDPPDNHDAEARIMKASQALGALHTKVFGSADVPERLKGKLYAAVFSPSYFAVADCGASWSPT